MMSEWTDAVWGELASLEYGKGLRGYQEATGPYPVYGTNGHIGWSSEALYSKPGVIIGRKGAYRGVHYSASPFYVIDTAFYLNPKTAFDPKWAYYQLLTVDINSLDSGSAIPSTSREDFYALPVRIPPLSEQRAIAHILGTLDDKIELNWRMNATLEAIARAIFKSWFVDFDPVHAKARGEQPVGMDADTAALFPDSFEESELGMIPRGWKVATIADLTTINEWVLTKNDVLDRIEYIEISKVLRGEVGEITIFQRGEEPSRARRRLRHGDTVLSTVRPDRGAYFLCLEPSPYLIASTGFAVVTPTNAPWSFIHAALTQPNVSNYLGDQADGAAYPAVKPEIIAEWSIAVPSDTAILNSFHRICASSYELAEQNRRTSRVLAEIRDALLPKLISGEVRILVEQESGL